MTDTTSKTYIVAEVWSLGARFVHPNPRNLPDAIAKVRELATANRAINPRSAATSLEIYELRAVYPVWPAVIDEANPGLPPAEDVLDPSKSVKFPNV